MECASIKTYKTDNFEIIPIVEICDAGSLIEKILKFEDPTLKTRHSEMLTNHVDISGGIRASVLCYLIKTKRYNILVDTGVGNYKERIDMPEWSGLNTDFISLLSDHNVTPDNINYVFNTHLHFDHIGWNTELKHGLWSPTFKNATYLLFNKEFEYWEKLPSDEFGDDLRGITDSLFPVIEEGKFELIDESFRIEEFIEIIPSFGHTVGHCCLKLSSQDEEYIISGDLFYHPIQIIHPNIEAESDKDPTMAVKTRLEIFEKYKNQNVIFLGGHAHMGQGVQILSNKDSFSYRTIL